MQKYSNMNNRIVETIVLTLCITRTTKSAINNKNTNCGVVGSGSDVIFFYKGVTP